MKCNQRGIDLIKVSEGLETRAYRDVGGIWTIGYGHTTNVKQGMEWTREEADTALASDLAVVEHQLTTFCDVHILDWEFSALCDFVFNLGFTKFTSSTLAKLIQKKDYNQAAFEFAKWIHVNGHENSGLRTRREREKQLFLTGDWK